MRKRITAVLLALVMVFTAMAMPSAALDTWDGSAVSSFGGGKGTEDEPYIIATAKQFARLTLNVANGNSYAGKYFKLTSDIDLASRQWTPVGSASTPFAGTFDGQFHKISNLYISQNTTTYTGLFGYNTGTIKNLIISSGNVTGYRYTGAVAGFNSGLIRNCENASTVNGNAFTAGIVGHNTGTVSGCSNSANVFGTEYTSGIVAYNYTGTTTDIEYKGEIADCYNTGYISGVSYSGGIAGALMGEGGSLKNAYNSGTVVGRTNSGAIAGYNNRAIVSNCHYLEGSAVDGIGNSKEGTESKTSTMLKSEYFTTLLNNDRLWSRNSAVNGGYPCFKWQNPSEEYDDTEIKTVTYIKPSEGFAVGNGSAQNPYLISSAGELEYLARSVCAGNSYEGKYFVLDANIQLNANGTEHVSTPIGDGDTAFKGDLDGAGHYIKGLYQPFEDQNGDLAEANGERYMHIGLFGNNAGNIYDLAVVDASVSGFYYVGILAAQNSGVIERCYTTGELSGNMSTGGIAGQNSGTINNCYNTAKVKGMYDAGGIAGENAGGTVYSCYNTGTITGTSRDSNGISAIAGRSVNGNVENCYYYRNTAQQGVTGDRDDTVMRTAAQFLSSKMVRLLNDEDEMTGLGNDVWTVVEGVNINYPTLPWATNRPEYVTEVETDDGQAEVEPPKEEEPPVTEDKDYYKWDDEATDVPDRQSIALPSTHRVLVNGKEIKFDIYNIGGNNYFKLRDVAHVINGTEKQFEVKWQASDNSIHLTTGTAYTPDGYEMIGKGDQAILATPTLSTVYLNGRETSMVAYFISDNNYFKIRDLAKRLGFDVLWDGENSTVVIDTSITYIDDENK